MECDGNVPYDPECPGELLIEVQERYRKVLALD
jgi:hypothetical protein